MSDTKSNVTELEILRQEAIKELENLIKTTGRLRTPQDLEAYERRVAAITNKIADLSVAIVVQKE